MAADLRYTTADVDFLESHFSASHYDSGKEEYHQRLRNPNYKDFCQALENVHAWLEKFSNHPDWDGGGFQLCFAGHGRQGDGALVLEDSVITPRGFMDALTNIAHRVSPPGRLRISAVLDSCHSGAFVTEFLHGCLTKHNKLLVPFHVFASCMEDEVAWEESSLGHGLYTYCFSVREPLPSSIAAVAIQPDNSFGPSLAVAGGELGCSLLTAGAQNPVAYWNGTGHIGAVNLFEGGKCLSLYEMRARLKSERDERIKVIKPMRDDLFIRGNMSDEDIRVKIQEEMDFILSHRKHSND